MGKTRKITAVVIAVLLMSMSFGTVSKAASCNVALGVSSGSVKVGDTVTVNISVSCDSAIGSYSMAVTYNAAVLQYTGGSGSGGGGTVNISGYGDGSATKLSASLTFKAIGEGSSAITTTGGEAYNWNEEAAALSHGSASVTVATAVATTATASDGTTTTASANNKLSSLQISPGTLSPAFSANTTSYTASVAEDVTKLVVSAVPADGGAKVAISGNSNLVSGSNTVKITVTAPSGVKKTYTISVTKAGEVETTEAAVEEATVNIGGKDYVFAMNIEELTVPQDFTESTAKYGESDVLAFESPTKQYKIVCLLDGSDAQAWYIIDEKVGSLTPYIEYQANANRYVILTPGDEIPLPVGFSKIEYDLDGVGITAYADGNENGFILIYATTVYGEPGLYTYDTEEGTFQRYIDKESEIISSTTDTQESTEVVSTEATSEQTNSKVDNLKGILFYVFGGLTLLFFIMVIILVIQLRDKRLLAAINQSYEEPKDIPTIKLDLDTVFSEDNVKNKIDKKKKEKKKDIDLDHME